MKTISDIRLYKSEKQNEYGTHSLCNFADKKLNAMIFRIVMKLREQCFSLGEFDHLYFVFTTCAMKEEIYLSQEADRYHPWYRECFIKVNNDIYSRLEETSNYRYIISVISTVLVSYFSTESFNSERICSCIQHAIEHGENMLMKFKEKSTTKRKAVIFLRYNDMCMYRPLLRVYDTNEILLFEKDLPESLTLDCLGEIQLSTKKVTLKPRKNAFTHNAEEMVFEY